MLSEPILKDLIRYVFIIGISLYSSGLSFYEIMKKHYLFYSGIRCIQFIFLFNYSFFQENYKYDSLFVLLWNQFLQSFLTSYHYAVYVYLATFAYLFSVNYYGHIDKMSVIYIPLFNQTFMTLQCINDNYSISFGVPFDYKKMLNMFIMDYEKYEFKKNMENIMKIIEKEKKDEKEEENEEKDEEEEEKDDENEEEEIEKLYKKEDVENEDKKEYVEENDEIEKLYKKEEKMSETSSDSENGNKLKYE